MLRRTLLAPALHNRLRNCYCCYHEVSFATTGEPLEVLEYCAITSEGDDISPLDSSQSSRVEMWDAPWNPADMNTVQGRYASPYPNNHTEIDSVQRSRYFQERTISGSEGWGRVTDIQGTVSHISVGDIVTVGLPGLGTLRSSLWVPPSSLIPIARGMELHTKIGSKASALSQLGGTAIRMLRDFSHLSPGDIVIQNAGNSGVGLLVSQLAKILLGVQVVSMVRRGTKTDSEWEELVNHVSKVGKATLVVAEEEVTDKDSIKVFLSTLSQLSASNKLPSLAFNAVGGESASILSKCLDQGGTMVTYGGMSMKPITVGTPQFIFKNLRLAGYWHGRWMVQQNHKAKQAMVNELVDAVLDKHIECPPIQVFSLNQLHEGLLFDRSQSGIRKKVVFSCREQ